MKARDGNAAAAHGGKFKLANISRVCYYNIRLLQPLIWLSAYKYKQEWRNGRRIRLKI